MIAVTNAMGAIMDAWWLRGCPGEHDHRSKLAHRLAGGTAGSPKVV